jgi:hypothetical protein
MARALCGPIDFFREALRLSILLDRKTSAALSRPSGRAFTRLPSGHESRFNIVFSAYLFARHTFYDIRSSNDASREARATTE